MVFFGFSFFGDSTSVLPTATNVNNINYVELKNGIYDDLYITRNTTDISEEIPEQWDHDTILHAGFEDNTNAGNVDWTVDNTTALLVKRKEVGETQWMTIAEHPVSTIEDFTFAGIDKYARGNSEYQYAIVPTLGNVEGNYTTVDVESKFEGIFLAENDIIYGSYITGDFVDTTRVLPSTVLSLPNQKYGVYCSNSIANYDTGSISCTFVYLDEKTCEYDFEHIANQTKNIMKYLTNRKPKLLKIYDGRMWLIMVTGNPTDTGETSIYNRIISFEWAEIGDCNSEKDLYYANLSNVPRQWWNT